MNGSRANSPRHGDTSSLDALNRTIEGLEARIEGLMAGGRDGRARVEERYARAEQARFEPSRTLPLRDDPVSEIMQRQRALESSRDRPASRQERRPADDHISARELAQRAYTAPPVSADPSKEIAQALVGLRQELKKDLSEGLTREMNSLRAEIRGIRQAAETHAPIDDIRQDIDRLAASITQIARQSPNTETDGLRVEFDELRSVLDGLAREDSVRRMEDRWTGVEQKLSAFDQGRDDELVALAYRLDELKTQIGSISATPAIRDLENKVHLMAEAVEALDLDPGRPVAYAVQTTYSTDEADGAVRALRARFSDLVGPKSSDICYATTNRQAAVKALAPRVDFMLIAGDPLSSNAARLGEVASASGCRSVQMLAGADELQWSMLDGARTIGITAAASTPEEVVEELLAALRDRFEVDVEEAEGAAETIRFKPLELA